MSATKQNLPPFPTGLAKDGWSNDEEATATCFCGNVQVKFPTQGPGLVNSFVCHCSDCHKFTASMFASNFTIEESYLKYIRGEDSIKTFSQSRSIETGNTMTNHFCSNCGTLMFRVSSGLPTLRIMRIGTVDDFELQATKLAPTAEQWISRRHAWMNEINGVKIRADKNGDIWPK